MEYCNFPCLICFVHKIFCNVVSISKREFYILQRQYKNFRFKTKHGFKTIELFNLNYATAEFMLPKLKLFKETTYSYPAGLSSLKKWKNILDKIIFSLESEINQFDRGYSKKDYKKINEGFELLGKYFRDLWI